MTKFLSKIFLIILLLQPTSCRWIDGAGTPYFTFSNFKIPDGTPAFRTGYTDGCSSALYARGNVWYKTRYKYRYDPKMMGNPEYRFGHSRGYTWCFQQAVSPALGPNSSWDRAIQPYGYDKTFSVEPDAINKAWGGFFGGLGGQIDLERNPGGLNSIVSDLTGGDGGGAFSAHPLWAGGSKGQIFGQ